MNSHCMNADSELYSVHLTCDSLHRKDLKKRAMRWIHFSLVVFSVQFKVKGIKRGTSPRQHATQCQRVECAWINQVIFIFICAMSPLDNCLQFQAFRLCLPNRVPLPWWSTNENVSMISFLGSAIVCIWPFVLFVFSIDKCAAHSRIRFISSMGILCHACVCLTAACSHWYRTVT